MCKCIYIYIYIYIHIYIYIYIYIHTYINVLPLNQAVTRGRSSLVIFMQFIIISYLVRNLAQPTQTSGDKRPLQFSII